MTIEPTNPKYPVHELTTSELSTYRRQLEHAVHKLADAPVLGELRLKLDSVVGEQEARARIARDPEAFRV